MKFARFFFLTHLLGAMALLSSCSKGELAQESQLFPFQVSSKTVLDYTNETVKVRFVGEILEGAVSEDERLEFYTSSSCGGAVIGSALVRDFKSSGADLNLPIGVESEIFISSPTSSECLFVDTYQNPVLTPTAPVFGRTEPQSPSRDVTSPGLFGSAFPPSATVEFFSDASCSVSVTSGPVSAFSGPGMIVPLPINTITVLHAVTKDALGQQSGCTEMVTYEHNNSFSSPPRMTTISDSSPSNQTFTPTLRGSTDLSAVGVSLYSDSGCTNELASGSPSDFLNFGFQITSTSNSSITIYGRSVDSEGMPSVCARLTTFVHDDIDPAVPIFVSVNPASPTNATTVPSFRGTTSADTQTVTLFSSNTCLTVIGSGTKAQFESPTGISGGVSVNTSTDIYAKSFDEAGNDSTCVLMTNFVHNNIPPSAPLFLSSDPPSPTNGTLTPLITGTAADRTVSLTFYKDDQCSGPVVGSGNRAQYEGAGITVNVDANTNTSIYVTVSDVEGNVSECTFHAPYDHSSTPAPDPGFFRTFPDSPTRASNNPAVIGTADNLIETVVIYDDGTCTNSLGSGTRGQYISSGINIAVPPNSTTDLHAQSTDIYGNLSSCAFLTTFVHNTVLPSDPTFTSVAPLSPNNSSFTPTITGTALVNPASQLPPIEVSFYDSPACVSRIGQGTPSEYSGAGVTLNVAQNAETFVYARVFDEAGNRTACTFMTSYIHNSRQPAVPVFGATMPASPSYTVNTSISGSFGTSLDFMNRVSVIIYSDNMCVNEVTNGSPTDFEGAGIPIVANANTANPWYAVSVNEVGTRSDCVALTSFVHHDDPITGFTALLNSNGSVNLNWTPDLEASPLPRYSIERSLSATGPFTVLSSDQTSSSFTDLLVSDNMEYFYRVFGTNNTGRGQNTAPVSINITSPPSVQPVSLNAIGRNNRVTLTWSGFPQNMTYSVSRSLNYGGPFVEIEDATLAVSYLDATVSNGQNYYYVVTASNPSGLSMRSNVASVTPRTVPAAPIELVATPYNSLSGCGGGRGLRLSWAASSYNTGYRVSQSTTKNGVDFVATPGTTTHEVCNPINSELRYYRIASRWDTNNSSDQSNPRGFFGRNAPSFSIFPGNGEIVLDWSDLSAPTSPVDLSAFPVEYDLYRSTELQGKFSLHQSGLLSSDYIDVVPNGTTYFYFVQPYLIDGGGDKIYMSYPTQTRGGTTAVNPVAPTNLSLIEIPEESRVQLQWVPPTHYNGFLLYKATNLGGPYTQVDYVTSTSILDANLTLGMNYFRVSTAWGSFESADSNVVSFRNAPITSFNATASPTSITLNWDALAGVQDYVVTRATSLEGPYASVGTALSNTYEDATASSGVGYYYKVRARFADFTEGQLSTYAAAMRSGTNTPTNVSLRQSGPSGVQAVWPFVDGATNYIIRTSDAFGGPYTDRGSTTNNTFTVNGNLPDTEVFFTVSAIVSATSHTSAPVSIITYSTPNAPAGSVGNNQVDLTWSAVSSVLSYDILRTQDGITFTTLSSAYPTTTFTDATALNGNVYLYKIRLNFPGGETRETNLSNPLSPGQTPLAPGGLTAENNGSGTSVVLRWGALSGATRYNIYRSTTSGSYGAPIQNSNSPNGTTVSGLTSGTTYFFRITARNGSQEGAVSNEVSIVPSLTPAAPTAEYSSETSIDVSWSALAGASTYNLERSTDGLTFETVFSGLAGTSQNDATVNPDVKYFYRYQGFSAGGAPLATSSVSSGVQLSTKPQVPVGLEVFASNTSEVTVEWVDTPNVFGYEILRGTSSGGPYTLVGSPIATDEVFVDASVVSGTTYFYVMRSLNSSKAPSPNSVEKAVTLNAGPTGLAAVNSVGSVNLSWSSVPGAVSYNVKRSRVGSGPYAQIANVFTTSYSDTSLVADLDYFYVAQAVFADGSVSVFSNEASVNRDGFVNLQVVVELTDTSMQSLSSVALTFERSRTTFDTSYYDGTVSYELEVVAQNFDSVSRDISLVDNSGVSVGSVVVPSGLTGPTRIKVAVSPNVGFDVYRLRLEQTGADFDLSLLSAKLLVNQIGATRTRLYFPLLSSDQPASSDDGLVSVYETSSETYDSNVSVQPFERRIASLERVVDYNAWELETVVSTTGVAEGMFVFQNMNTGLSIDTTETRFVGLNPTVASVPIDENILNFATGNEGDFYKVDLRCEYNCGTGVVKLHKAGLWVELENLSKARVVNRIHTNVGAQTSTADIVDTRVLFDASRYSSPTVYFQTYVEDDGVSDGAIELVASGADSGALGLTPIAGSNLFVDNDDAVSMTSPPLTVSSGQRLMTRVIPTSGEVTPRGSVLIIDVE